jgi:hypothetical protein
MTRVATQTRSTNQVETDSNQTSVTPTPWQNVTMRLPLHVKHCPKSIDTINSHSMQLHLHREERRCKTKLDRLFAATYKKTCAIHPYGHKTFIEEIPRDNPENYLLREQKKTAEKHIRNWKQNKVSLECRTHTLPFLLFITLASFKEYQDNMKWSSGYQAPVTDRVTIDASWPRSHLLPN